MGKEIERKFLLKSADWKQDADNGKKIMQGYLCSSEDSTTRVRVYGKKAFLTIKGKTFGISRVEFEYEIPVNEALELFKLCRKPLIEKTRFIAKQGELKWEIDIFEGENKGLKFAEIELESEFQNFDKPEWIGAEVTYEKRYYNSFLVNNPYKNWENKH
jgi:adenylate cyclase